MISEQNNPNNYTHPNGSMQYGDNNNQMYGYNHPMNNNGYNYNMTPIHYTTDQLKKIITEIYERQKDGVEFHMSMVELYDFLHLDGFKKWQEERLQEETEKLKELHHRFIKRHYSLLGPMKVQQYTTIIPLEYYNHTSKQVSKEDISKETKRSLKEYVKWEEQTLDFYKKKMKELSQSESYSEYVDIRELIDGVAAEIEFVENFMMELESVGYDTSYIQRVQERFAVEFGEHSPRIQKKRKTY